MKKLTALILCFALALSFYVPVTATEASLGTAGGSQEPIEVLSKREVYSKTYLLPDGTYQYVSYAEPIHYKDSTGNYVEINNTISNAVRAEGYRFANTANSWDAHFSEKITDQSAVKMTDGNYQIAFSFVGQTASVPVAKATQIGSRAQLSQYHKELAADDRAVFYADVMEQVDIAYTVQVGALKEDIILKAKPVSAVFKFRLTTNGLALTEKDGVVKLCNVSGKEIFEFLPLYMEDANGKRSNAVSLAYSSVKGGYELTVTADMEFLSAADTAYPVVIDPSVVVSGADVTYDTCIDEQYPDSNYYLAESLWTGGALGTNAMRTYLKFSIPTYIASHQVLTAYLYLQQKDYQTPTIRAYRATGNWNSSSITWNTKTPFSRYDYSSVAENTIDNWYEMDVKEMVKDWLAGNTSYYGFVIKEPSESNSSQKTKFYSSDASGYDKPELVIHYTDYFGSRPYQRTSRQDVNCAGYALEIANVINAWEMGIWDMDLDGCTLDEMEEYVAACFESWMCEEELIGSGNWIDSSLDGEITEGWYKIVLRVGFEDRNRNGIYNAEEERWDYHFWYQTDTGEWADKQGYEPSQCHLGTQGVDPTSLEWDNGDFCYNSGGVFYELRDIRDVAWGNS